MQNWNRCEAPKNFGHFEPYFKAKSLCFGAKRRKFLAFFGDDLKKNNPARTFFSLFFKHLRGSAKKITPLAKKIKNLSRSQK